MDCPSCGLANPPEAPKCDCGYDFSAGKPADFPSRKISWLAGAEIVPAIALRGLWRICETTAWTVHLASRIAPRIHLWGDGGPVDETAQTRARQEVAPETQP